MYAEKYFSSNHPFHAIFHEAGHWVHANDKPSSTFEDNQKRRLGSKQKKKAETVSDRAMESPNELIAETFAAILAGKTVSSEVLELVGNYGGVFP